MTEIENELKWHACIC